MPKIVKVLTLEEEEETRNESAAEIAEGYLKSHPAEARSVNVEDEDFRVEAGYLPEDTGNGERLKRLFGDKIRWIAETNTWMVWSKNAWREDKSGRLMKMTKAVLVELFAEATEGDKPDQSKLKHALSSGQLGSRKAMVASCGYEDGVLTNLAEWDSDPWQLNAKNGVIDGLTGKFRERTKDDLLMRQGNVDYNPKATCPIWERCVSEWTCGDQELAHYLQVMAGLALVSDTSQQILWFHHGGGQNGKGTFFNVVTYILGTYWKYTKFETWAETKYGHSEHRNDLAAIAGAVRLVTSAESADGRAFDEGVIKQVTGGTPVDCRQIHGKPFTYTPQYRMWFMSNHEPVIKGSDWGIWRRAKKVPWDYTVPEDKKDEQLAAKLEAEASGILNWMLAGLRWYIEHGKQTPKCKRVDDATAAYRKEMDLVGRFMDEHLLIKGDCTVLGSEVYRRYDLWCIENGTNKMSSHRFHRELKQRLGGKAGWRDVSAGLLYEGMGVRNDANVLDLRHAL